MQCIKCGAELPPGADACPECGEEVSRGAASAGGATKPRPESQGVLKRLVESKSQPVVPQPRQAAPQPKPAAPQPKPAASGAVKPQPASSGAPQPKPVAPRPRRAWLVALVSVIVVAILAAGGYLVWTQATASTGPDGAALRMMKAYATYDAAGILANATHSSLDATDQAAFAQTMASQKAKYNNVPAVKDVTVVKVTMASQNATIATVQLSESELADASTRTYTPRTETLTVVKQDGQWLVRLF